QEALHLEPDSPNLHCNIAEAFMGCGFNRAAERCFESVLRDHPDFPPALSGMGDIYRAAHRPEDAVPLCERAAQLDPAGEGYKSLADARWDLGDASGAVAAVRQAIIHRPNEAGNHIRLGMFLAGGGDLLAAADAFRTALRLRPGFVPALVELAQVLRGKLPDSDRLLLEKALDYPLPDELAKGLHFALAQVCDGRGEYGQSARHLERANALAKARHEARNEVYNPEQIDRFTARSIELFTPAYFVRTAGFGSDSERPVFIVGMPRSGTTLIEQILASHPSVYGAGERLFGRQSLDGLPRELGTGGDPLDCLDRLTPAVVRARAAGHLDQLRGLDGGTAARVVDKMPDNHSILGWLATTFPKARFIHARRDVRDVALSCWMSHFALIPWACDLKMIAHRTRAYLRIMDHWRATLPVPLLEIDYERLVADQEAESRKLLSFLGLEWDPACLQFHRTERLVKTASLTQVRQPMYAKSVGRWKKYEAALAPFLQEIGK
ncbi:MAG: tetratricopeptide repeat-containing sulfotransferase family protein, partial [Gemmataceae bacterium]